MAVDPGDPALPVAGRGSLHRVRKSKNGPRRAIVLIALHGLIALHAAHFFAARRTLSPVEPSEAMYTLELGRVNAGFIFLLVALAATLVFGRFICGWGCHIVALQDSCAWLMKKAGIRPRPFRSRLLLWVPAAVAFYMFFWPSLARLGRGLLGASEPFPELTNHLATDAFWATFPGPIFTILTFATCGFAAVYLLGAKGFCTYGCPYGALFGGLDRFTAGAILVDDRCEQCGHCTVTCTSNVLVHEEVRRFGRVVDPGCMKCMDCVSVCPKGALRFGFARPSWFAKARPGAPPSRRYALSLGQEIMVAAVCVAGTLAFRGLYDGPPLLMSVGLGGISGYVALVLWRLAQEPVVRLQNLTLKIGGRPTRSGRLFALAGGMWLLFASHSAAVQWERMLGRHYLQETEATRADALSGAHRQHRYSQRHDRAVQAAYQHFSRADRWGLARVTEIELGLAWTHLLRDESAAGEAHLRNAVALAPGSERIHDHLVDFLAARGRTAEAIDALEAKLRQTPPTGADQFRVAGLLVEEGRAIDALPHYEAAAALAPGSAGTRYNLGGLLRRLGRSAEAVAELEIAASLAPEDADTQVELGLALVALGRDREARTAFQRAIELAPESPESRLHLPELIRQIEARLR